jgi:hypothetical protein
MPRRIGSATGLQLARGEMTPSASIDDPEKARQLVETVKPRRVFYLGLLLPAGLIVLGLFGAIARPRVGLAIVVLAGAGIVVMVMAANVEYEELKEGMAKPEAVSPAPTPGQAAGSRPSDPGEAMGEAMGEALGDMMTEGVQKGVSASAEISTTTQGAWGWSLALYIMAAACGVADLVLPRILSGTEPRAPGGGYAAAPPPGEPGGGSPPPPKPQ